MKILNKLEDKLDEKFNENVLQMKALVNFYFKEDVKISEIIFEKSQKYYLRAYSFFTGVLSPFEAHDESMKKTLNKILEEANIYYQNKK